MLKKQLQQNTKKQQTLYCFVFESPLVKIAAFVICCFLLLQPVAPVLADSASSSISETPPISPDSPVVPNVTDASVVKAPEADQTQDEPVAIVDTTVTAPADTISTDAAATSSDVMPDAIPVSVSVGSLSTSIIEATDTDPLLSTQNEPIAVDATTSSSSSYANSTTSETAQSTTTQILPHEEQQQNDNAEATDENSLSSSTFATSTNSDVASTSEAVAASSTISVSVVNNNSNAYQFSDKECTSVGSGAFYCSESNKQADFQEDGVFAAPDSDGDMEIFIRVNGKESQITHNTISDMAPYYDAVSKRIVWHSMQNDRFQIMSYDLKTEETTQLTNENYNNMQPVAYGDVTLWQAWIGNNWEIMESANGSTSRLTNNAVHDVSPSIRDGRILWQTQFSDGWRIAVYDVQSKSVEYIAKGDGSMIENPRMVLVYDAKDANGDVKTVGYDFNSKSTFDLGNIPASVPDKLPNPDTTGETRALLQTKTDVKEGDGVVVLPTPVGPNNNATSSSASSTVQATSSPMTLIIGSSTLVTASTTSVINNDILVTPLQDTSVQASTTTHIPDVVIPSASSSTSTEVL